jgi:hypothetical protein
MLAEMREAMGVVFACLGGPGLPDIKQTCDGHMENISP